MKTIPLEKCKVGMMIAADIVADNEFLILKKDTYVTDFVLELLAHHNITHVTIDDSVGRDSAIAMKQAAEDSIASQGSTAESTSHNECKIQTTAQGLLTENNLIHSEEFQEFKADCFELCDTLNTSLNRIIEKHAGPEHAEKIINESLDFYRKHVNAANILDMLQCMHEFSDSTFQHSINVGMIASLLGRWCGWSEEDIELLVSCGVFHDIGKIKIPDYILHKPGKLTKAEFAIMRSHTTEGYKLLQDLPIDEQIKLVTLRHHMKCDGSGYPMEVLPNDLDRFSKIITIADVYEAMTANRAYRKAVCPFKVVEMFAKDGYSQYDTQYLLTFLQHVVNTYIHSHVKLSNDAVAEVIMINRHNLSKPLVFTEHGEFLDLSVNTDISIVHLVE